MDYLKVLCSIRLILTEYSQEERTQQEKYSKIFTDFHRMLLTITKQGERPHPLLKLDYLYGRSHGTPQRTHRLQHHSDIFPLANQSEPCAQSHNVDFTIILILKFYNEHYHIKRGHSHIGNILTIYYLIN